MGSNVARERRTTAVAGSDSVIVTLSFMPIPCWYVGCGFSTCRRKAHLTTQLLPACIAAQRIEDQIEVVFREPGICGLTCLLELAECVIALTESDVDDREREGRNLSLAAAELQFLDGVPRVGVPARRPVCMAEKRKMHGIAPGEPGDFFESGGRG